MTDIDAPLKTAVAYFRTSSPTNSEKDDADDAKTKDTVHRQREAIEAYAVREGVMIVKEFYDKDVKGDEKVWERSAFNEMLSYMMGNGARIVLVERADRFARDAVVQITGHDFLKRQGIDLIAVDAPAYFLEDTPTAKLIRGVLALISEFEKLSLVEKLRRARERKKALTGWCGGRRPVPSHHVAAAKQLHSADQTISLRRISERMAELGMFQQRSGQPYKPNSIKLMLARSGPLTVPVSPCSMGTD